MSVVKTLVYERAIDGAEISVNVQATLQIVDVDGVEKVCLVAQISGGTQVAFEVEEAFDAVIDGKVSGIYADRVGTTLASKYTSGLTITVEDDTGFADKDGLAIFNSEGDTAEFRAVEGAPAANVITMNAALDSGPYYKGAYVVRLNGLEKGSGRGFAGQPGVRSVLEQPQVPAPTIANGAGNTITVSVPDPGETETTYWDVYVRDAKFTKIEPNWIPDLEDQTEWASAKTVSTFGGGTDCVPDGTGGSINTTTTYWVAVVMKRGSGRGNVSAAPYIEEFTTD